MPRMKLIAAACLRNTCRSLVTLLRFSSSIAWSLSTGLIPHSAGWLEYFSDWSSGIIAPKPE